MSNTEAFSEDMAPEDAAPKDTACKDAFSKDTVSNDATCKDVVPEDAVPKDAILNDVVVKDAFSKDTISKDAILNDTVIKDTVPKDVVSENTAPEDTAPENTVFKDAAPEDTAPEATADFGDFVKDENEELELEELVEPWHKYDIEDNNTVFYPIFLGEVLNERYQVEHKLGFGGGSAVWMAFDLQEKINVALKVMILGEWADNETRIQDEIIKSVQDTSRLVTYTASFILPRDDGSHHRVLVFPMKGPAASTLLMEKIPMATRMSAARQLLEAVANLHEAGILHRDLNAGNCMWGMAPIDDLSRTAKYELLGRPLKQTIPFVKLWKRGELVSPVEVPDNLRTDEFYICDFGLAKKIDDKTTQTGFPPPDYCSPDRLHGHEPSFACDMWSYMVMFSMLYLEFPPFSSFIKGGIVSDMVECLGPLPEQWKDSYPAPGRLDSWYDQSKVPVPKHTLAAKIAYFCPESDLVERELVQDIMSKVFTFDIEKRLTAKQLLQDPSFRALMDRYGC